MDKDAMEVFTKATILKTNRSLQSNISKLLKTLWIKWKPSKNFAP